jgi:superoxide dismutase, Fe-Mn family
MTFIERKFDIGELSGISTRSIEEHLKLYSGYVKHANLILTKITELGQEGDRHVYTIGELQRRFAFEFDGLRNHEYYFEQFEGGHAGPEVLLELGMQLAKDWGTVDTWLTTFKTLAMTRGVGWAVLYFDKKTNTLLQTWVEEQHLGQLVGLDVLLVLDMWEHSYMLDYAPSEKKKYVEAFFQNINWEVVEKRFRAVVSRV